MVEIIAELIGSLLLACAFAFCAIYLLFFWLWPVNDKAAGKWHWAMLILSECALVALFFKVMEMQW
jgi:hypothetical protein